MRTELGLLPTVEEAKELLQNPEEIQSCQGHLEEESLDHFPAKREKMKVKRASRTKAERGEK